MNIQIQIILKVNLWAQTVSSLTEQSIISVCARDSAGFYASLGSQLLHRRTYKS